ncbi:MAG: hypothetical protein LQ347_005126 [Umbilicaria vellea]|nr:MAG: hypothetical protein LQ347_005126 [Umbilicaria vellea]
MADAIALQADLGLIGAQGFGAFKDILAAASADNVAPGALLQIEQLGSLFHCNGKYLNRIVDLLQRCESFRFERLALSVGWRRHDTASTLSKTAGGQAVSLLIACLMNMHSERDVGEILRRFSIDLVPRELNVGSQKQISGVARCVSEKISSLGISHFLAEMATQIRQVYMNLNQRAPLDLVELPSVESMVDLLKGFATVCGQGELLLRLTGTEGMAYFATFFLAICPEDTTLTVEGIIIQQGLRNKIFIDVRTFSSALFHPAVMVIEGVIADGTSRRAFPLKMHERRTLQPKFSTWNWDGWLLDRLRLAFVQVGALYPPLLSSALARLIFTLHAEHGPNSHSPQGDQQNIPSNSGGRMRISLPAATSSSKGHTVITQFCSRTLCVPSLMYQAEDAGYLITQITSICGEALGCHPHDQRSLYDQAHAALWQTVAAVILEGYFAAYVIAGVDVTVPSTCQLNDNIIRKERARHNASDSVSVSEVAHQTSNLGNTTMYNPMDLKNVLERISEIESGVGSDVRSHLQESGRKTLQNRQRVIEQILDFPISLEDSAEDGSGNLGVGNGSSVLFSEMLEQCAADETGLSPWLRLEAGQFVFNTKNYSLISSDFSDSALEIPTIQSPTGPIQPCNIGQHTGLMLTMREKNEILKLRLTVQVDGNRADLDLRPILDNWRALVTITGFRPGLAQESPDGTVYLQH